MSGRGEGRTGQGLARYPRGAVVPRSVSSPGSGGEAKEVDVDALGKYAAAVGVQFASITAFLAALDKGLDAVGVADSVPPAAIGFLFFILSLRSRVFSPLENRRPDLNKARRGEETKGFNDRRMPSWTPPGVFFPIMWILIIAPLRATSSTYLWAAGDHTLCQPAILALMLHLSIGDTWNTINNVERRLGAAVPGVLSVWLSVLFAVYCYNQALPTAGTILAPTAVWITVAAALVTDTWRINNEGGDEPLYPYKSPSAQTSFWFESGGAGQDGE